MTIEELIDYVNMELQVGGTLPKQLPDTEIRRIVEKRAMKWFYQNYQYAVQKLYYFVDREAFNQEEFTKYSYITLPCEIQTIPYIYTVTNRHLFNIGINQPNLSVNLGVSNQPYLSSYVSTIGELGLMKTVLDSFSDMLNQLSKFTVKYQYNQMSNRLHILTKVEYDLVLEAYANIEAESLFDDPLFLKYTVGLCRQQLGRLLGTYDYSLPGNVKINHADMITTGKEEVTEVETVIKEQSQVAFFYMVKR